MTPHDHPLVLFPKNILGMSGPFLLNSPKPPAGSDGELTLVAARRWLCFWSRRLQAAGKSNTE
jgi:hypothetical protein